MIGVDTECLNKKAFLVNQVPVFQLTFVPPFIPNPRFAALPLWVFHCGRVYLTSFSISIFVCKVQIQVNCHIIVVLECCIVLLLKFLKVEMLGLNTITQTQGVILKCPSLISIY